MKLTAMLAAFALAAIAAAGADDKDQTTVKEIPIKDLKVVVRENGRATRPDTIASAEELSKSPVVGQAADDLKKQIDFRRQKLLVFSWSGSGQDRVLASIGAGQDKKPIVSVQYIQGRTFDLREHVRLFVVPKDLKVVVEAGK